MTTCLYLPLHRNSSELIRCWCIQLECRRKFHPITFFIPSSSSFLGWLLKLRNNWSLNKSFFYTKTPSTSHLCFGFIVLFGTANGEDQDVKHPVLKDQRWRALWPTAVGAAQRSVSKPSQETVERRKGGGNEELAMTWGKGCLTRVCVRSWSNYKT